MRYRICALWRHFACIAVALNVSCAGPPEQADVDNRTDPIIGGTNAAAGAWPWMVNIKTPDWPNHECGGALLGIDWVLTAGHCVSDSMGQVRPKEDFTVVLGDLNIVASDGTEQTKSVSAVYRNPSYTGAPSYSIPDNDTALLRLSSAVDLTSAVQTVRPAVQNDPDGTSVTATGWGWIDHNGTDPNILQQVGTTTQSSATCGTALGYSIPADQVCAGVSNGSVGACHGDSGGPLVTQRSSGAWEHVGIVSWGDPSCYSYSVFARVASHIGWVRQYVMDVAVLPARDLVSLL